MTAHRPRLPRPSPVLGPAGLTLLGLAGVLILAGPAKAAPELRAGTVLAAPGATVGLPVAFVADGTVTALRFDLAFDPALLSAGAAVPGPALLGGDHELDSELVEAGRLRAVLLSRTLATVPAGVVMHLPLTVSAAANTGELAVSVETVELVSTTAGEVTPAAILAGTVRVLACLPGDVFPEDLGDGRTDLADQVLAWRTITAGGSPASRFVQCADLAPGSFACAESPPFGWCATPDDTFDVPDALVLRALAGRAAQASCEPCLAADLGFEGPLLPADVTEDGRVDVLDVVKLLRLAVQLEPATDRLLVLGDVSPTSAPGGMQVDVLGDGRLNVSDVVVALRAAVQLTLLRWRERRLAVTVEAPTSYVAWSVTLTGIARWAAAERLEGDDCDGSISGLDLADTTWAATCVTDPILRVDVTGTVGELVYRAPQDLDPTALGVRSSVADGALTVVDDVLAVEPAPS